MADTNLKILDEGLRTLVFDRFKTLLGITNMAQDTAIYPKELAQRMIAEKRGDATLEFINVWRTNTRRAEKRERLPLARSGLLIQYADVDKKDISLVKAVPTDLDYSIWFWSKDKDKLNAIAEKFLFWKFQDPNLNLLYEGLAAVEYDMLFGSVADESPVVEMFTIGMYFVIRVDLTLEGWVFDPATIKTVHKVFLKVYDDVDPGGPNEISILLFEQEYDLTV